MLLISVAFFVNDNDIENTKNRDWRTGGRKVCNLVFYGKPG